MPTKRSTTGSTVRERALGADVSRVRRLEAALRGIWTFAGGRIRVPGAMVFAYHDIGDDPSNTTDYYVSPEQMRRQLTLARQWGLRFVDLAELTDAFLAGRDIDGLAAVAFDDSLVGVHHHAMPVLLDLGIPATVFTVSDRLGESPPWWPGAARVMTEAELREMAAAGFRISSHTKTHASLTDIDGSAMREEIAGSRKHLEDLIGAPVDLFAYPFGHYNPEVRAVTTETGYRAAFSFLNGRIVAGMDEYQLPRLNMISEQGRLRLAYHLARPPSAWPDTQLGTVGPSEAYWASRPESERLVLFGKSPQAAVPGGTEEVHEPGEGDGGSDAGDGPGQDGT